MRRVHQVWALALLVLATFAIPAQADYDTVLASRIGTDGPASNRIVYGPEISANGRYIAFASNATNFPGAGDPERDARIYRKDTKTGALELVSRADGRDGAPVQGGDWPALSRSGRYACWVATAFGDFTDSHEQFEGPPPTPGDRLMVRDIVRGETKAIPGSAVSSLAERYEEYGSSCSLSADGTKVAYQTKDSHDPEDDDRQVDVYLYDFGERRWTFMSRNGPAPYGPGELGPARHPEMTPDGRYVVFYAMGGRGGAPVVNPLTGAQYAGTSSARAVFVADAKTGELQLVSRPSGCDSPPPPYSPPPPEGDDIESSSLDAAISDDGRYVAFASSVTNLDRSAPPLPPRDEFGNTMFQVYVHDRKKCLTRLVSRASGRDGKPALAAAHFSAISPDGRYVAFGSGTHSLDPDAGDDADAYDIFIRDWKAARTTLVTRRSGLFGAPANGTAVFPQLSANKGRVVFLSTADNLTPTPTPVLQIYYRETVGSRGLLPADLPGRPKIRGLDLEPTARGAFRRGRSVLLFGLSEFARLQVEVTDARTGARRIARSIAGDEGRNRVALRRLRAGRYRVSVRARDFAYKRSRKTVKVVIR